MMIYEKKSTADTSYVRQFWVLQTFPTYGKFLGDSYVKQFGFFNLDKAI